MLYDEGSEEMVRMTNEAEYLGVCEAPLWSSVMTNLQHGTGVLGDKRHDTGHCSCTDVTYCDICHRRWFVNVEVGYGDIGDYIDFDVDPWVCECDVCLRWRWSE